MQYDIGDAPLDPPVTEPKQTLTPEEDQNLTKQIQTLYEKLLPTADSDDRRKKFIKKLERILKKEWPGIAFTVDVFGSSGNMLCTTDSDGRTLYPSFS
jgi:DNA polymerase sigma